MTPPSGTDRSNGWDAVAAEVIAHRAQSRVGEAVVRSWARSFAEGLTILDLGCGSGVPISQVLMEAGLEVYGIDASPSMVAAFQKRFSQAEVVCEAVEESSFFNRTFDGVVAWGLMFLLPAETQRDLIHRVAQVLRPGGRFLFTAPAEACTWEDLSTGRLSLSLGADAYKEILAEARFELVGEGVDEGRNHYYEAEAQE